MSGKRVIPLAIAALVGVPIGWALKPDSASAAGSKATGPSAKRETRQAETDASRTASKWIDRMKTGDPKTVAKEVPADEVKAVMNALMDGVWGKLSKEDITRMQSLIGAWAEKDPEAALAWARDLRHPKQRELGLTCIATAIGRTDPEKGFAIYAEVEKVTIYALSDGIYGVVSQVYTNAMKQGSEALVEVMLRTPRTESQSSGLHLYYPQGFDFQSLLDGMSNAGYFKRTDRASGAFYLESPLAEWAGRDRDAAFTYLADHANEGTMFGFHDFTSKIAETSSQAQMKEWVGEKLAAMESRQRQELVKGTMMGYPADYLNRFIEMMPTREDAAEFRYDILQAYSDAGWSMDFGLFNQVPEIEDRLAMIGRLSGVQDYHAQELASQLRKWNVPEDRIGGIVEKVKRKE